MRTSSTTKQGFTLVELLTVIAIIAILAGLLFPAIKTSMLNAEAGKAKTAIAGLSIAFRAYNTEYGKWPVSTAGTNDVTTPLVGILRGEDRNDLAGTVQYQGNPRHIVFLEFKTTDLVIDPSLNTTNFVDPWKQVYHCAFDTAYTNWIQDPFQPANNINAGFLIWSSGPDGQYDNNGEGVGINKDNVKSW